MPTLAGPRSASKAVIYLSESALSAALPRQHLVDYPDSYMHFEPAAGSGSAGLEGMAYAGFALPAPAVMDATPVIQPFFIEAGATGDFYIALGNYDSNRWDWYQPANSQLLELDSWTPYFRDSSPLLVVLAFRGATPWIFGSGWLGNPLPGFNLSYSSEDLQVPADVTVKIEGLTASFDVSSIEWDMDNDGDFEYSSADLAERTHSSSYSSFGMKTARVRVKDSIGEESSHEVSFHCTDHRARSWGLSGDERATAIAADPAGNLYLAGSSDGDAGLLLKYDSGMNLVWAREWDPAGSSEEFDSLAVLNGDVYVAGRQLELLGFGSQTVLQRWGGDGNILTQKLFGADNHDTLPARLLSFDGTLLLCGRGYSPSDFEDRALVQSFSAGLERNWGLALKDMSAPMALNSALDLAASTNDGVFVLLGEAGGSGGFGLLRLDSAGNLVDETYYDGSSSLEGCSIGLAAGELQVCSSTGNQILLARFDSDLVLLDDLTIDSAVRPGFGCTLDAQGRWIFCGGDGTDATYWQIDYAGAAGRFWSYNFSGFSNVSGGLQMLSLGGGVSYLGGYADWATGMSCSRNELLSVDFGEPSATVSDPNFDLSTYSQSLSNTSKASESVNGTQNTGADLSMVQGDMALLRFASEE
ncbi:hypothetical protein IT575_07845 [bacterium]|nr:hypothetical protein [bacterium]